MIPFDRSGLPAGYSFSSYSASFKKKKNSATYGWWRWLWLYRIGPGDTIPSSLNNNNFAPDITSSPPNNMNVPTSSQSHSQKSPFRAKALYGCAYQNSLGFGFDMMMYDRYRVAG